MTDIDETIRDAMLARAEGGVHVEELLAGATRHGVRRRRVHRALLAGGTAAVVLAVGGALAVLPWGAGTGSGADTAEQPGRPTVRPSAPATGLPSARPSEAASVPTPVGTFRPPTVAAPPLGDGGQVGTDQLLHLDVADPAASRLTWSTGQRRESLAVERPSPGNGAFHRYEVLAANTQQGLAAAGQGAPPPAGGSAEQTTFRGRPATLWLSDPGAGTQRFGTLTWQQAPDAWVRVVVAFGGESGGRAEVLSAAALVRFEQVRRCLVSFRLAWTPAGTRATDCWFAAKGDSGQVRLYSGVRLSAGGAWFRVGTHDRAELDQIGPLVAIEGRQVRAGKGAAGYAYSDTHAAMLSPGTPSISQSDAIRVIEEFEPVTGDFPQDWVRDPLH